MAFLFGVDNQFRISIHGDSALNRVEGSRPDVVVFAQAVSHLDKKKPFPGNPFYIRGL